MLASRVPAQDDLMVQRMKAAGGILIGKTNTPEFAAGPGLRAVFRRPAGRQASSNRLITWHFRASTEPPAVKL
jgi:hypothetical protein